MRPTSLLWLFSSVLLLANAVPVPVCLVKSYPLTILKRGLSLQRDSSELANVGDSDTFEVDLANVDRRDLDKASGGPPDRSLNAEFSF